MKHIWQTFTTWFLTRPIWEWWNPQGFLLITPSASWKLEWAYVALIGTCLLLAIVISFWKFTPSIRYSLLNILWGHSVAGAFLFFFRDQRLPYLGMDVWRLIQEIILVVNLAMVVRYYNGAHQQELLQEQVKAYKAKYLPKAKKA